MKCYICGHEAATYTLSAWWCYGCLRIFKTLVLNPVLAMQFVGKIQEVCKFDASTLEKPLPPKEPSETPVMPTPHHD